MNKIVGILHLYSKYKYPCNKKIFLDINLLLYLKILYIWLL